MITNLDFKTIIIDGLFGKYNYKFDLKDNKLILVAENGNGKTTIMSMIFYALGGTWFRLLQFKFSHIRFINNNDELFSISKNSILEEFSKIIKSRLGEGKHISAILADENLLQLLISVERANNSMDLIYELGNTHRLPVNILVDIYNIYIDNMYAHIASTDWLPSKSGSDKVLFLPTYRRIERAFRETGRNVDKRDAMHYRSVDYIGQTPNFATELVGIGMKDVKSKFEEVQLRLLHYVNARINNDLSGSYLKDIVNKKYNEFDASIYSNYDENDLQEIFDRIDKKFFGEKEKFEAIRIISEVRDGNRGGDSGEKKLIAYTISRIFKVYRDLKENEQHILSLIDLINKYLVNKKLKYDKSNFTINLLLHDSYTGEEELMSFHDLSSGEKQLISLFVHLTLSGDYKFFLLIDEPELSLSVEWQRQFLVDVSKMNHCAGFIAVTHSPFIFDNFLVKYVEDLRNTITSI